MSRFWQDMYDDEFDFDCFETSVDDKHENQQMCMHKFIPMFNNMLCEYCGIDKTKVSKEE